ncbi:hypothetical protein MCERE10_02560 [Burkholderiaceae bacterium]
MKIRSLLLMVVAILSGCSTNIDSIDVSDKNPQCVRQCSETFSNCVSGGLYHPSRNSACKEAYQVCVKTCPNK